MKKLLTAFFAVTTIVVANAQSISNVNTYVTHESVYNDPADVYYANDSIFIELTVHFPSISEMSELTNTELFASVFLMDFTNGDYANDYIVTSADATFTVATIPYGTTKTYKAAYYVGNITASTDMEIQYGTDFSKTDGPHDGNGIVDFTYNL